MTKARNEYIYQLTGTIKLRQLTYPSPQSQYADQPYYKLTIKQENQPPKLIRVFKEKLINPTIWAAIQHKEYAKKTYLFKCRNLGGRYYLVDWEEIAQKEVPNELN